MIEKPPHGAPCNGCGVCCRAELCTLAAALFQTWEGPCPALVDYFAGGFKCGLVLAPDLFAPVRTAVYGVEAMRRSALFMIGAGIGCDALDDDEPADERFTAKLHAAHDADAERKVQQSLVMWAQLPPPD